MQRNPLARLRWSAVAVVVAKYRRSRWAARLAIVLLSVPVAVVVNGLNRVATTAVATYHYGPGVAEGFVHQTLGG